MPTAAEWALQPIAGVSPNQERLLESVYPSVAASPLGRTLGGIFESIPMKINGVKLSYLLFCLPLAPIALVLYLLGKLGNCYVLTNRSVEIRSILGKNLVEKTALAGIETIQIVPQAGQAFYRAADLELMNGRGDVVMKLVGVPWPERFRMIILEARQARVRNDESLARIDARK
jgi:hypothetical protein